MVHHGPSQVETESPVLVKVNLLIQSYNMPHPLSAEVRKPTPTRLLVDIFLGLGKAQGARSGRLVRKPQVF